MTHLTIYFELFTKKERSDPDCTAECSVQSIQQTQA